MKGGSTVYETEGKKSKSVTLNKQGYDYRAGSSMCHLGLETFTPRTEQRTSSLAKRDRQRI